jgi:beta-glucosidase
MELARQVCAANPNTAALLFCGRPLTIVELHDICPSILCMWQPGTAGGTAAARLLFGDVNPSGKLTMTWPRAVGQCPLYYNQTRTGRPCWGMEVQKKLSMTSNYIDEFTYPLYNFGHGLSYTKFEYTDAALSADSMKTGDTLTLSVKVKNAGDREGQEVVQLYIRKPDDAQGPLKTLRGFERVTVAPGKTVKVEIPLTDETFNWWDETTQNVNPVHGTYELLYGGSSADDALKVLEYEY